MTDRTRTLPLEPDVEADIAWITEQIREAVLSTRPRGRRELGIRVVAEGGKINTRETVVNKQIRPREPGAA